MNLEEQYDKIYRYCYFKVKNREIAEDITQETFLRFFENISYVNRGQELRYLYTIARNLCVDEYRRKREEPLPEEAAGSFEEENMVMRIAVRSALEGLEETDRELLLMRHVNGVPVSVIAGLYGMSRFAAYRRILQAEKNLKSGLGKEGLSWTES